MSPRGIQLQIQKHKEELHRDILHLSIFCVLYGWTAGIKGPSEGKNGPFYIDLFHPSLLILLLPFTLVPLQEQYKNNLLCLAGYYNRQPLSWQNIHLPLLSPYTRRMDSLLQHLAIIFVYFFCIRAVFLQLLLFLSLWCRPFDNNQGELFF